jgi:hypothetical protein
MLSVGHGITDDILKENLEHSTGLFVDEARDPLHSTTTSEAANGGFGDPLDVVTEHLAVTLGSSLPQSLSSFATTRHTVDCCANDE